MDVEITKDIIAESVPKNCMQCPMSIALTRATGAYCFVFHEMTIAYMRNSTPKSECLQFTHSPEVVEMIRRYDITREIKPCTLQVFKGGRFGRIRLKQEGRKLAREE